MSTCIESFKEWIDLKKGSVLGGVLLLSGSCIGVGMLALPILTGFAGPIPTLVVFVLCALFMTTTALLLLEVITSASSSTTNIISLAEAALGKPGKLVAWTTFIALFYSLLVAYIAKGGELIQQLLNRYMSLPEGLGAFILALGTAIFIYFGTWIVDHFNRWCMILLFVAYCYCISAGFQLSCVQNLEHTNWSWVVFIIPFIVTSFGFHNMLPTVHHYLEGNRRKLITTVIFAAVLAFILYITWVLVIQSILPLQGTISIQASFYQEEIATEPLAALTHNISIRLFAQFFAFFAIITSLLSQALSVLDFLADGFKVAKNHKNKLILCAIIFVPTFLCSQLIPGVFFKALEFVGGVAAMILFGILPATMVWVGRYHKKTLKNPLVPGGKLVLAIVFVLAFSMVAYEGLKHFL